MENPLSIKDNPRLDNLINGSHSNNNDGFDGDTPRYCRKCGKPIIWHQKDKDGQPNPHIQYEWDNKICHNCLLKLMNKSKPGGDDKRRKL